MRSAPARSATWPSITCTKRAESRSPCCITCTSSVSWNVTGPSKHCSVSAHHADCSGRLLLRIAEARSAKRATRMQCPSSVQPPAEPRNPSAPGRSSSSHTWIRRCTASGSEDLPSITWMNMALLRSSREVGPSPAVTDRFDGRLPGAPDDHAHGLLVPLQLHGHPLGTGQQLVEPVVHVRADHQLAAPGHRLEPRRDVDRVAEGGEVRHAALLPHLADERPTDAGGLPDVREE